MNLVCRVECYYPNVYSILISFVHVLTYVQVYQIQEIAIKITKHGYRAVILNKPFSDILHVLNFKIFIISFDVVFIKK